MSMMILYVLRLYAIICSLDNGKEVLSLNEVLLYLLRSAKPLIEEADLPELLKLEKHEWQTWVDKVRGMIVSYPGMVSKHSHSRS